jgi:EAL domain-containing protein (putative c-di-GMP-specific phosphodiesterase class I)
VNESGERNSLPTLRHAERDAAAIRDILCDPEIGTFDPADVTLFAGPGTRAADIKVALRRIALNSDPSDLLLVYFAGYTLTPSWSHRTDAYLVTPDLDESALSADPDAGLRMAFLARDVLRLFAGTSMLILDCCQAGRVTTTESVDMIGVDGRDDPRSAMLVACAPDGRSGLLTQAVLAALSGRAVDDGGVVTFEAMTDQVLELGIDPAPAVLRHSQGTTVLTRPGVAASGPGRPAPPPGRGNVRITSLEGPLDRHGSEIRRLIGRLSRMARQQVLSDASVAGFSRVEYLRSAVEADAVAYLSYGPAGLTAIDATSRFDLEDVRHLLRTADGDGGFPLDPRWFGHVAQGGGRRLWCAPLDRSENNVLLLAVTDPPAWLTDLGQPGAKVLETVWRADFSAAPADAEIEVLTALRRAFGRLPGELFAECLERYQEVLESFAIVFQPIVTIGETWSQVGVHSYEALARRTLQDRSAPWAMLQLAHTWGDHFVVVRDKIILAKALTAYAAAHDLGPWDVPKPVSVNVSVRSLLNDSYIDRLRNLIADLHLDPSSVTLEISEQDPIEPWAGEQWREAPHTYFHNRLAAIVRDVGVAFAVDDFGSGYASISRMAELPLTQIKVDRAILHHRQAQHELELVVTVARDEAHATRIVIVEGVDDMSPLTLRQIYKRGIKHVQGHITGERGAADLRALPVAVRKDLASRVRGDDEDRPARLTAREDRSGGVHSLRKGA